MRLRDIGLAFLASSAACSEGSAAAPGASAAADAGTPLAPPTGTSAPEPPLDAGAEAGAPAPVVTTRVITTSHRAVPGKMFGGWGPHLGHLVRRPNGELWFVDDACDAATPCDVNVNGRFDAFRLGPSGWERRAQIALAGIQQNTGTIVTGDVFETYGVDVGTSRIVVCRLDPGTTASSCAPIAITLPPSTNYVGAAVSPEGWKLTWATTVVDGGGGTFHWLVDYGGGWNGPRTGAIGGYNDASYVNVAFFGGARKSELVAFAQLVAGTAPSWTFHGATANGDAATVNALSFDVLPPAGADPIASTNDVVVDPATNDVHLVARTNAGAAAIYFRASSATTWGAPTAVLPATYRARFVQLADGRLVLVYGKNGMGLWMRVSPARVAGKPVDWASLPETRLALPADYEDLYAIYPEAASYQRTLPKTLDLAVVSAKRESEALHVHVDF